MTRKKAQPVLFVVVLLMLQAPVCGAITKSPPETAVHLQRALQYQFQDNVDGAIVEYRRALQIDPNSLDAHDQLGLLLLEQKGDVDGAISEFVTALSIDPKCTICQLHLDDAVRRRNSSVEVNIAQANTFYRAGQLNRAVAAYRIACYVAPDNAEAHNSLAWTLYRLGALGEAMVEVKDALRLKPNEPEYINTLACVQFDKGELQSAIANFERAITLSKKINPADLYGLAVGYLSAGQKDKAVERFKQALKDDPHYADQKYLRERIGMSSHTLAAHDTLLDLSGWKPEPEGAEPAKEAAPSEAK